MWLSSALRSALPCMFCIQPGCWACHARVWPRTCLPFWIAQFAIWSPREKLNWFCDGSVASIFISFSAVIILNSRFKIVVYSDSLNRPAGTAAPKYRPLCAAAAPNVLSAACAGAAAIKPATTDAMHNAAPTKVRRPGLDVVLIATPLLRHLASSTGGGPNRDSGRVTSHNFAGRHPGKDLND